VIRALALALILGGSTVLAQGPVTGHVSFLVDALPDPDAAPGRQPVSEARVRVFAEHRSQLGDRLRIVASGHVDGLVGRSRSGDQSPRDAVVRPLDLYAELVWPRAELRAGASRIVWGRLDEFQPTDVVNPIDLSKFLLEGRSEARLSVGVVRGRFFLPASTTVEALVVPGFRPGRFDQLDEPTSPFNLGALPRSLVDRREPQLGAASLQGGVRVTSTVGRVDWGATVYRGLRTFPIIEAFNLLPVEPFSSPSALPVAAEVFPRFTMLGGDFETVRGAWGVRGEVAFFVDDTLQSVALRRGVEGASAEGGIGVDRRAGSYRLSGNVLVAHRSASVDSMTPTGTSEPRLSEPTLSGTDVSFVVAADRSFARETRTLRVFAVSDPGNGTSFVRAIGAISLRDDVWLEGSGGVFTGASTSTLGRLTRQDFLYARLKVHF
jgi:hypothetical protein